MLLALQRESHTPLYTQIVAEVRRMIVDGALKVGDRLPANRELAKTLGVNRNTVTTAYAELAADGLITSRSRQRHLHQPGACACAIFTQRAVAAIADVLGVAACSSEQR